LSSFNMIRKIAFLSKIKGVDFFKTF